LRAEESCKRTKKLIGTARRSPRNRELIEELLAGNNEGSDIFPETQVEIDRLKAQIAQSELIVAAYEKEHSGD
jgi:hypothetical protein